MTRNYIEELKIDEDDLVNEWIDHPSRYAYWAEQVILAQTNKDRCRESLDVIRAEIDGNIRREPANFSLPADKKPTEGAITAIIALQPEYKKAQTLLANATEQHGIAGAIKSSFDHRKSALQGITQLILSEWYSKPTAKEEKAMAEIEKKANEKTGKRLRKAQKNK